MKIGDLVRVVTVPDGLNEWAYDDPEYPDTKTVFQRCIGSTFPVIDVTAEGLIELEVGEAMGVDSYLHSIWIEPEHLALYETSN